jgi:phosphate starvation-inducible PhoH-like protein
LARRRARITVEDSRDGEREGEGERGRGRGRGRDKGRGSGRGSGREGNKYRDGILISAKNASQRNYILEIQNNDLIFCTGPAGTGKTAVAVGMALQAVLAEHSAYERLVIIRPVKEACGESLGYLPGDLQSKMAPWAAPIVDNMKIFIDQVQIKNLFWGNLVEIIPLALARGRSLVKSFIILDEAQNCSRDQLKMALTRIGEGSKMVITGDLDQSDVQGDGLGQVIRCLQGMPRTGICEFRRSDIVRNPMISEILRRLDGPEEEAGGPLWNK